MAKIPIFVEKGFTVSCLIMSTGALTAARGITTTGEVQSDSLLQIIWLVIYTLTLLLLIALRKSVFKVVARDKFLWVLMGIILFSTLWSTAPQVTLRRAVALVGTTLFGVYLATRYKINEQLRLLAWAFGICAILSLLVAIAIPSFGIDHTGAWRGIFVQKNSFARIMVLSAMVFLIIALTGRRHRWFTWAMFGLSSGLILLSTSKSALVNLVTLLVLLLFYYRSLRWQYTKSIPLWIFSIVAVGSTANLLLTSSELLLQGLGKDATLTGRTELWAAALQMLWKQPVLGYGYDGFWTNSLNSPAFYVWNSITWRPLHAHNGFLNVSLEIGLLGLSVFLLGYAVIVLRAIKWVRLTKTAEGFWPLLYLTLIFMYNLTESSLLNQNSILWILYSAVSYSIPIQYAQAKRKV